MHVGECRNKPFSCRDRRWSLTRVDSGFGMLSPWLKYNIRFTGSDDVTRRRAFRVRGEAADVVFVAVSGDDGVQLTVTPVSDVFSDQQHLLFFLRLLFGSLLCGRRRFFPSLFPLCSAAKVDQNVTISGLAVVTKGEQETVAKPDVVTPNSQTLWFRSGQFVYQSSLENAVSEVARCR